MSCKTIKFPAAAANNLRGSKTGPLLSSSSIVDRCVWDSVAAGFYTWLHFFLHAYFEKKETDDPDMI